MAYTGKKPIDHTDVTQSQSMTVTDDLTVDSTTLHVDSTNNRVGVGNVSPAKELDVTGAIRTSTGMLFGSDTAAANTLNDYEEGTFTPNDQSGAGLTFSGNAGTYTKIGRFIICQMNVTYPTTSSSSAAKIGGLPFTNSSRGGGFTHYVAGSTHGAYVFRNQSSTTTMLVTQADDQDAVATNANLSGADLQITFMYQFGA